MALTQYRVRFTQQYTSYNAGDIGYFPPNMAAGIVAAGIGTALDALPANLPGGVAGYGAKHQVRTAKEREVIASESDRQIVAAAVAAIL